MLKLVKCIDHMILYASEKGGSNVVTYFNMGLLTPSKCFPNKENKGNRTQLCLPTY